MNDFTKEELEDIGYVIDQHLTRLIEDEDNDALSFLHLGNKIQAMIDNYCEHGYLTFLQDQNNEPFIKKCIKCHCLVLCE